LGCKSFFFFPPDRSGLFDSIKRWVVPYRVDDVFVRTGVNGFLKGASERGSVF